jgi:hypothetical protein
MAGSCCVYALADKDLTTVQLAPCVRSSLHGGKLRHTPPTSLFAILVENGAADVETAAARRLVNIVENCMVAVVVACGLFVRERYWLVRRWEVKMLLPLN